MKSFPYKFRGDKIKGKNEWVVVLPFIYNSKKHGEIEVPVGFHTDGATIPRIVWIIVGSPWGGKYSDGAVIHDWIYHDNTFSRKVCDEIFLEAMEVLKVPLWKRRIMYRALRMFGWIRWKKKKENKK